MLLHGKQIKAGTVTADRLAESYALLSNFNSLDDQVAAIAAQLDTVDAGLAQELLDRADAINAAKTLLQGQIAANTSAIAAAVAQEATDHSELNTAITNEAAARAAADTAAATTAANALSSAQQALQAEIDALQAALDAASADSGTSLSALQTALNNEITNRTNAVSAAAQDAADALAAAQATLQGNITTLSNRVANNETTFTAQFQAAKAAMQVVIDNNNTAVNARIDTTNSNLSDGLATAATNLSTAVTNLEAEIADARSDIAADITAATTGAGMYTTAGGEVTGEIIATGGVTGLPAPINSSDAVRLQDLVGIPWKASCRVASTSPINTTTGGLIVVDGITVATGDRVLVKDNTVASGNGIWVAAEGAWARAADASDGGQLRGAVTTIEEGTNFGNHRFAQISDNIVVGTTGLVWVDIGTGEAPSPAVYDTTLNKGMTALTTATDGALACNTGLTHQPSHSGQDAMGYVSVHVNGLRVTVGTECYFSADGGTTRKDFTNIDLGDKLYWVGSEAGYQLDPSDRIDFDYATI